MISRQQWGADESLRDGEPAYIHTIKQVHVHHTVNSNTYEREDVPALLRGMYAYHTRTLGWSDIGYNFLVDRFGRSWVGRAGGAGRLVRGSHTLGFNAESSGISAIGNYDTVRPSSAMLDAIAAIAAWKLDSFDRDPGGEIDVESDGSDNYAAGLTVVLQVIDGHRDTNDTSCPGQYLYEALPDIRLRTTEIMAASAPPSTVVIDQPAVVLGLPHLGNTLSSDPGVFAPPDASVSYQWLRDGQTIRHARDQNYAVRTQDVGSTISCQVTISRTGLAPVTQEPPAPGPTTAEPTLSVTTSARRRLVKVHVNLTAPPGVRLRPTGAIAVTVGNRTKTVALVDGEAQVQFRGHRRLPSGTDSVEVVFEGDVAFTGASSITSTGTA